MINFQSPRVETLVYVIKEGKVLLIYKKRGFGAGKYNGVGGKVHVGESIEDAARREFLEETGANVAGIKFAGILLFYNNDSLESIVHVYRGEDIVGELKETEEAIPLWFDVDKIPYDQMWEDDKYWLPLLISNKKFLGRFWFKDWKLIKGEVYELSSL